MVFKFHFSPLLSPVTPLREPGPAAAAAARFPLHLRRRQMRKCPNGVAAAAAAAAARCILTYRTHSLLN